MVDPALLRELGSMWHGEDTVSGRRPPRWPRKASWLCRPGRAVEAVMDNGYGQRCATCQATVSPASTECGVCGAPIADILSPAPPAPPPQSAPPAAWTPPPPAPTPSAPPLPTRTPPASVPPTSPPPG